MLILSICIKKSIKMSKKLAGRWLGQGPMVDKFENNFKKSLQKIAQ